MIRRKGKYMDRRKFIVSMASLPLVAGLGPIENKLSIFNNKNNRRTLMANFELPKLPYEYDALEPYIDRQTMEIHHTKHHQAYVTNLNKALEGSEGEGKSIEDLMKNISKYPTAVRNNGGGHYNHSLFWTLMRKGKGEFPKGDVEGAINSSFGSFEQFKKQFSEAAMGRFGSGWAWLIASNGKLEITSTPNQDNPLMDVAEKKGNPILGLDVWEHAYYLKYQNKRAEYVENWWNVVNWEEVNNLYSKFK
jgi:superoxide dismutase, Fe-Mn family